MVELARQEVPAAQFAIYDCRHLLALHRRFEGITCAFGLPYLSPEEVASFIGAADEILDRGGVLYLSTMLGDSEDSCFRPCSTGDQVYIYYHNEDRLRQSLNERGFSLLNLSRMPSPDAASKAIADLIVLARK
jgi:predicted TPR repeat methyltransferase